LISIATWWKKTYIDGWLPISIKLQEWFYYLHCQKPTEDELSLLHHSVLASNVTWDPSHYDNIKNNIFEFDDSLEDTPEH
jgi:hypothetical protein